MYSVAQSTKSSKGGHKRTAWIIPADDANATTWPGRIANPSTNAEYVSLEAGEATAIVGKAWRKIVTQIEQLGAAGNAEGTTGSKNLASFPKIRINNLTADELGFVVSMIGIGLIYCAVRVNGDQWMYGSPELPCYLDNVEYDFGTKVEDDAFIEFTLRCVEEPALYSGSLTDEVVV